ncbi:MAG: hypothetical protein R2762_06585 [Bryobacteraceae bacterium]
MRDLRAAPPIAASGLTIVPIEEVILDGHVAGNGFSAYAHKEPVAVVIVSGLEIRAFSVSGAEVDQARLAAAVPGLEQLLATIRFT